MTTDEAKRLLVYLAISFIVLASLPLFCSGHSHDHGHSHDADPNPAFKYSRQANEKPIVEDEILDEDIIDLPPQHGHSHGGGHGHSHGGHGHSHGGHGHSHGGHGHSHGGHGHSHGPPQREPTPEEREAHRARLHKNWDDDDEDEPTVNYEVWMKALLATFIISIAPFFILFVIPLDNSLGKQWLLKTILSFASGGLLGDAFLHLIPHALMASGGGDEGHGHSHSHGHSHGGEGEGHVHDMSVGLGVLAGIVAFLSLEKIARIVRGGHGHSHGGHSHGEKSKEDKKGDQKEKNEKKENKEKKEEEKPKKAKSSDDEGDKKKQEKEDENEKMKEEVVLHKDEAEWKIAGILNLLADFFHNFTDGLAIGAAFMTGNTDTIGIMTTFTILFHEIPHEIGDYAILIQSGVPRMRAILLQLMTALGAMCGCLLSLYAGSGTGDSLSLYILPFTAGGFIYIATVSIIPELLEGASLKQSILEMAALLGGVGMMVIIAQFE